MELNRFRCINCAQNVYIYEHGFSSRLFGVCSFHFHTNLMMTSFFSFAHYFYALVLHFMLNLYCPFKVLLPNTSFLTDYHVYENDVHRGLMKHNHKSMVK